MNTRIVKSAATLALLAFAMGCEINTESTPDSAMNPLVADSGQGATPTPPPSTPSDPSDPTAPGVTGDEIDISNSESLGPHSGKAAQKATVTRKMHSCSIRGGNVQMSFDPLGWSTTSMKGKRVDGGVYLFWEQGGQVVGGLFDWHGVGQTSKTLGNVYGENYLGRRPPTGATVYFAIVSLDVQQRTNVKRCSTPWP